MRTISPVPNRYFIIKTAGISESSDPDIPNADERKVFSMDKNTHRLDGITCDAEKCAYNENHACHAASIKVESGNACEACETECSTFKNRCDC